jgi:hypothetical protein
MPSSVRFSTRKSVQSAMTNKSPLVLLGLLAVFGAWEMMVDPVPRTAKLEQLRMTRLFLSTW